MSAAKTRAEEEAEAEAAMVKVHWLVGEDEC
jgi:hypothetical protein